MLREMAGKLDNWVAAQNAQARVGGWAQLRPCTIKVLGQIALMETGVKLTLAATKDVDVYADYDNSIEREFVRLLAAAGHEPDPVGPEIWSPRATRHPNLKAARVAERALANPHAPRRRKRPTAPA